MCWKLIQPFFILVVSVLVASAAWAQKGFAPVPQIPYGLSINLETAKKVTAAAVAEAQKNNWKMAVAIVDTGGHLVYFEKMDGTQTGSVDLAIEKASTSALFRRPTKVFEDYVAAGGVGLRFLRFSNAIPVDGGFPIIVDGKLIGAIGSSGGIADQDGQVAKAGAESVK